MAPVVPWLAANPSDAAGRVAAPPKVSLSPAPGPIPWLQTYPSDAGGRVVPYVPPKTKATKATTPKTSAPTTPDFGLSPTTLPAYLQSLFGVPQSFQDLQDAASSTAASQVAAMVKPYIEQQTQAMSRAGLAGTDILNAAQAVADQMKPLGDATHQDYADAMKQLQGFASGYQGLTGQDAQAEAAAAQQQFQGIGSPGSATNLGGDLSNVAYALGGAIPSSALASAGIAAETAARAVPGAILGAGQQGQLGALNQGYTAVTDLQNQINQVQAQLPALTSQYLANYQKYYSDQQANTIALLGATKSSLIGSGRTGYKLFNPITNEVSPGYVIPPDPRLNIKTTVTSAGNGTFLITKTDTSTGKVTTQTVTSNANTVKLVPTGRGGLVGVVYNPSTGKLTSTNLADGQPYPLTIVKRSDGSVIGVGGVDAQGNPITYHLGDAKTIPYQIKAFSNGGYQVFNPSTGKVIQSVAGTAAEKAPKTINFPDGGVGFIVKDSKGNWVITRAPGAAGQATPTSASGMASIRANAVSIANAAAKYTPAQPHYDSAGKITYTSPPSVLGTLQDTYTQLVALNPGDPVWAKQAIAIVQSAYAKVIPQLQSQAISFATKAFNPDTGKPIPPKPGDPFFMHSQGDTLQAMINAGFPTDLAIRVVNGIYSAPARTINGITKATNQAIAGFYQFLQQGGATGTQNTGRTTAYESGGGTPPFGSGTYQTAAYNAAVKAGIDPVLFSAQIHQESGFDPTAASGAGARGIAQIVPQYHPTAPPASDPIGQLNWAANYMAGLIDRYGSWEQALSVYNSGKPNAYLNQKFAKGQTFNYVKDIMGYRTASPATQTVSYHDQGMGLVPFTGVPIAGLDKTFLQKVESAAAQAGATSIVITSGKRSNESHPGGPTNTGVANSNHLYGHAIDGYAIINGKKVPLGQALLPLVDQFGLRSGDVKGFYAAMPGGYDPTHVDDGFNLGMKSAGAVNA